MTGAAEISALIRSGECGELWATEYPTRRQPPLSCCIYAEQLILAAVGDAHMMTVIYSLLVVLAIGMMIAALRVLRG
jgi:hypothetical protein